MTNAHAGAGGPACMVAGTGCRDSQPASDRQHLGEVTDQDKNCAVRAHARATPPLWHLLCNPDSIFDIFRLPIWYSREPVRCPALLTGGLRDFPRTCKGDLGGTWVYPRRVVTPVYSQISHLSTLFCTFRLTGQVTTPKLQGCKEIFPHVRSNAAGLRPSNP